MASTSIHVEPLASSHAASYRALMLEAYAAAPDAFTASVAEREPFPLSWWEKRLGDGNPDSIVFGAFVDGVLAGAVGLARETRPKTRHKADVFGMYVSPSHRGLGLGAAMMRAVIGHARNWDGMRLALLTVSEGNGTAQSLYERLGFIAFGTEPLAIRDGERFIGKVHMALDLARDLELEVTNLAWIDESLDNRDDQCVHGDVRLSARGIDFVPPDSGKDLSAFTGALHLLFTLEEDRIEGDHCTRLIPCSCNSIWMHGGGVSEMGCPNGIFADVQRAAGAVTLTAHDGRSAVVDPEEWERAVVRFVDRIMAFYDSAPPRNVPEEAHERDGWAWTWRELRERRSRAATRLAIGERR